MKGELYWPVLCSDVDGCSLVIESTFLIETCWLRVLLITAMTNTTTTRPIYSLLQSLGREKRRFFLTRSLQTLFHGNKIRNKNTAVLSQSPRRGHQQFCFLFHSHKILFCSHKILLRSLKTLFWSLEGTEKYFDRRTSAENHQYLDTGDFFLISFPRTTIVFPQDGISTKWNKKYKLRCPLPGSAHYTLWSVSYFIIWISK